MPEGGLALFISPSRARPPDTLAALRYAKARRGSMILSV